MTTGEFKNKIFTITNGEYEVLGEYINCDTPIKLKHNVCGCVWETTTPYSFTKKINQQDVQDVQELIGELKVDYLKKSLLIKLMERIKINLNLFQNILAVTNLLLLCAIIVETFLK